MRVRSAASILALTAFALYAATAARVVLGGDAGEFAALGAAGGVAHPPGYPLYVLWLRAFAWLPASSPAHRAALATALLGALAVAGVFGACRAWRAGLASSSVVAAAFAVSPRAWIASTQPEVFALNALLAAAIVGVAGTSRVTGWKRCALLGLLAGLGLANHHSIVLLAPLGVWGLVRGVREDDKKARSLGVAFGAGFLGLSPYAYVVYASRHPEGRVVWGDARHLAGLWAHFRRAQYGTTNLGLRETAHRPIAQIVALCTDMARDLLALPVVAAVGAFVAARRKERSERTVGWWMLGLSVLLAGPVLVARFPLDVRGLDRLVVERFHLLPLVPLAPLVARGLDLAIGRVLERSFVAFVAPLFVALAGAAASIVDVLDHHGDGVEAWMRDTLQSAEPRAVILGTGDHRLGAMLYASHALHLRDDVEYVDAMLLLDETYRARATNRLGMQLVAPKNGSLDTTAVAEQIVATGRPLYLADLFTRAIVGALPSYPIGTLVRVLPPNAPPPPPDALFRANEQLLKTFTVSAVPPPRDTWEGDLRTSYVVPWSTLETAFRAAGDERHAVICRARAAALAPASE